MSVDMAYTGCESLTIYPVLLVDPRNPKEGEPRDDRLIEFYVRRRGKLFEAFYLGFPHEDKEFRELTNWELDMRSGANLCARTVRERVGELVDISLLGVVDGDDWPNQFILIKLWEQMEGLGFLRLPENPFKTSVPPKSICVIDFASRFAELRKLARKHAADVKKWKAWKESRDERD